MSSSSNIVTVAVIQMAIGCIRTENITKAIQFVRDAAAAGAKIILLPELFESQYFPIDQNPDNLLLATPLTGNTTIHTFQQLAKELSIVLPISFFERDGPCHFNSVAIIDADGSMIGIYRKSHIPDGPGYQEKFYFSPGDTGFKVWKTRYATIGVGICWDQWFPECARAMALMGAELLLFPTAIGSEPPLPMYDSSGHWQRVQCGHAAANLIPLLAANRVGIEMGKMHTINFYGTSFICDATGAIIGSAGREEEVILTAEFDLVELQKQRIAWGVFRDRRPELYGSLLSLTGTT